MVMAGATVTRADIDYAAVQAVLLLREALATTERLANFLADLAPVDDVDALIAEYEYTEDEAYLLRSVFQQFGSLSAAAAPTFLYARELTGLQ